VIPGTILGISIPLMFVGGGSDPEEGGECRKTSDHVRLSTITNCIYINVPSDHVLQ